MCVSVRKSFANGRSIIKKEGVMQEPYWWYVLYTRSNAEQRVMRDIKETFEKRDLNYALDPFCPESEFYYRNKTEKKLGKVYRKRPLFPSYVFLETNMPEGIFLKQFSSFIYNSPDIVRILHYGGSHNIALTDDERRRFEYLLKGKRCIDHSEGYIVGDRVEITAGPLVGMEGAITHINRHNRMAIIKVEMFGGQIEAKVALEIIDKQ